MAHFVGKDFPVLKRSPPSNQFDFFTLSLFRDAVFREQGVGSSNLPAPTNDFKRLVF